MTIYEPSPRPLPEGGGDGGSRTGVRSGWMNIDPPPTPLPEGGGDGGSRTGVRSGLMKFSRRALLKGMLAGSAMAAAGLPKMTFAKAQKSATQDAAQALVLVRCGAFDARFANGIGMAAQRDLGAGPLPDYAATRALFESCRDQRLLGLMEDGAYVLFAELARDAGARLVFEGQHSVSADGRVSRHVLSAAAGFHGAGESLAAALTRIDAAFAIAETPVGASGRVVRGGDWSRLGFDSWHVAGEAPLWLHLAGVSRGEGCETLGVPEDQTEPLHCWPTYVPPAAAGVSNWSAALGDALARLATGEEANRRPAVRQAFVRRVDTRDALDERATTDSYVSFVMEA